MQEPTKKPHSKATKESNKESATKQTHTAKESTKTTTQKTQQSTAKQTAKTAQESTTAQTPAKVAQIAKKAPPPLKSKDKVAILLAGNDAVDFAIANVIIGLKRYNEDLITHIFIYHDIKEETRGKIQSLWEDRIIWIPYAYEDFAKDMGSDTDEIIPQDSRWAHFIYAKFHIFEYLKSYDYAIWLDCDTLVLDSLEDTLAKGVDARGVNVGDSREVAKALEILGHPLTSESISAFKQPPLSLTTTPISAQNPFKPNGSFLSFNACVLKKFGRKNATKQCFDYLKLILNNRLLPTQSGSDETPFGILAHLFNLDFEYIDIAHKVAIAPRILKDSQQVIHAYGDSKFWNRSLMFISFQEWFVNHKIWEKISGKKPLSFKPDNLNITSPATLYHFLWNHNTLSPLYFEIYKMLLTPGGNYLRLLPLFNGKSRYLDIHSSFFGGNVFYRFAASEGFGSNHSFMELQIVCRNNNLHKLLESLAQSHKDFALIRNKNATGGIADSYLTKNVSKLNLEQQIQALHSLITQSFNLFYKAIYHQDFTPPPMQSPQNSAQNLAQNSLQNPAQNMPQISPTWIP